MQSYDDFLYRPNRVLCMADTLLTCHKPTEIIISKSLNIQHIQKYGSAFLNTDGGVLIAGVLDNGKRHIITSISFVEEGKQ